MVILAITSAHTTLLFISGTLFSNRMPWISNLEKKMESDMSRKSNNKCEIIHLIMKWIRKKKLEYDALVYVSYWHRMVFRYVDEHICLLLYVRWIKNAIITVSLCITCLQLSFPSSHTLSSTQLNWSELY